MLASLIQSIKQYYCLFSFISFFSLFFLIGCEAETPLEYETKPERADKIEQKETENNKGGSTAPMESHVFAKGVTVKRGWYDVDKQQKPEDFMACWLITASNMLQWWQDRYIEGGNELPPNTPNGIGSGPYKLAIFDDAITKFKDLKYGGDIRNGLLWYIKGEDMQRTGHASPMPNTGGYLKNLGDKRAEYSERDFLSYDDWQKISTSEGALKKFSEKLLEQLNRGVAIGVDIKTHVGLGGSLHAITLWGADVNNVNEVTSIYITDSDDNECQLVRCPIEVYENDYFKTKEIAMKVPAGKTYVNGCTWAILRMFYIAPPKE